MLPDGHNHPEWFKDIGCDKNSVKKTSRSLCNRQVKFYVFHFSEFEILKTIGKPPYDRANKTGQLFRIIKKYEKENEKNTDSNKRRIYAYSHHHAYNW